MRYWWIFKKKIVSEEEKNKLRSEVEEKVKDFKEVKTKVEDNLKDAEDLKDKTNLN